MLHSCFVVCSAFATAESVPLESVTPVTHGSRGTSHASVTQQYSHLFHQASPSVAVFLATDQPNVIGSYLKTCFAQRQSVLASPLLAWLLNFVELD